MEYQKKINKLQSELGMNKTEAHEYAKFLDWIVLEDDFLQDIYPQFKIDIDPEASFMKMCLALWHDETTGIKQANLYVN